MIPKHYATPAAFRRALEDRLLQLQHTERQDLQRLRRQVAFDRLLVRLFHMGDPPWILKGGYAMELRLPMARTTRDIDLGVRLNPGGKTAWSATAIQRQLQTAAELDLNDHLTYQIGAATADLDGPPYGGARYPVEAHMAARSFAKFHLDVSSGDILREPYVQLLGRDWLAFAGIHRTPFPAISPEEQFAEKLHAYTLPRPGRPNTRVKDLVDLCLLMGKGGLDHHRLAASIRDTFKRRQTHLVPVTLLEPPSAWSKPFAEMAKECGLPEDITPHFATVQTFLRPILPAAIEDPFLRPPIPPPPSGNPRRDSATMPGELGHEIAPPPGGNPNAP